MQETEYGTAIEIGLPFDQAIDAVTAALADQGFGILADIDVKQTLKKKLNVEFGEYRILGACNPPLAYETLNKENNIGLLLPCNVVVQALREDRSRVAAINPMAAMSIVKNPAIEPIAEKVHIKLRAALNALQSR